MFSTQSPIKKGIRDFVSESVTSKSIALTFYCCSHNHQLSEASVSGSIDILDLDIADGGPDIIIT